MRRRGWRPMQSGGYERRIGTEYSPLYLRMWSKKFSAEGKAGEPPEEWRGWMSGEGSESSARTPEECARKLEALAEKWLLRQAGKLKAELEKEKRDERTR